MGIIGENSLRNQAESFVNDLVKDVKLGKFGLSLFLGAGISKNPPSNLPLANEVRHCIFEKLFVNQKLDAETFSKLEKAYPFEAFVQIVTENSNFLDYLVKVYEMGEPNKNHTLIARLAKEGYVREILTTNFDLQLEKALKKEGLVPEKDFKIVSYEDEFGKIDPETIRVPVILKIHGSVDHKKSIRTTLNLISSRRLLESRQKIIEHFFEKAKVVLILGYSFSDEFDVNPMLRELRAESKVLWIKHLEESSKSKSIQNLHYPLESLNGKIVHYNTDELIDQVWNEFMKEEWKAKTEVKNKWVKYIEHWNENLSSGQRLFIAARLLDSVQEPSKAEELYKRSLKITRKSGDERRFSYILNELAIIYQQKGDYNEAENLCKQSLEIKKKLRDQTRFSESLYNLANIHQLKGNYDEAERYYEEGLKIDRSFGNESGISHALGNIATLEQLRGNYKKAERLHNESLEIKKRLGDLVGVAYTLYYLAIIAQDKAEYEKAEQLHEQSLKIRKKLGDERGISRILHNLATIQQCKGNYDEAENFHKQGLKIDEELEDVNSIQQTLNNLGGIQALKGNYDKAEDLFKKSLQLATKLGDQSGISCALHNLAIIQKHKGNYVEAEILHKKGLEIDEKLGDKSAIAKTFYDLAIIQQLNGNHTEAERLYKKALKIAKTLGDKHGIALIYRQLGSLCERLGKMDKASLYYKTALSIFDKIEDKHHSRIVRRDLDRLRENRQ